MNLSKQFFVKILTAAGLALVTAPPAWSNSDGAKAVSLKQIKITFPAGTTAKEAAPAISRFAEMARSVERCEAAEEVASKLNGVVSRNDGVKLDQLPPPLQAAISSMRIGQATPPFGSVSDGMHVLILCGRS